MDSRFRKRNFIEKRKLNDQNTSVNFFQGRIKPTPSVIFFWTWQWFWLSISERTGLPDLHSLNFRLQALVSDCSRHSFEQPLTQLREVPLFDHGALNKRHFQSFFFQNFGNLCSNFRSVYLTEKVPLQSVSQNLWLTEHYSVITVTQFQVKSSRKPPEHTPFSSRKN